jgi:hypothetical protein
MFLDIYLLIKIVLKITIKNNLNFFSSNDALKTNRTKFFCVKMICVSDYNCIRIFHICN